MQEVATAGAQSEEQFAARVDALASDPARCGELADLLREDHPLYDQRGTAATVRMRGWVLLALARAGARTGLTDTALLFVLEELDTGADAYLIAAAARALRSCSSPNPAFAPFVMRAFNNVRYRDEPVSFEGYGEYADSSTGTSAVRELLAALAWLGPHARGVLPEIEALRTQRLSRKVLIEVDRALEAIRRDGAVDSCCALPEGLGNAFSWARRSRGGSGPIEQTLFEDQDGVSIPFKEFFTGHPSIVVFFYTRCDNPLKCSLTVTKLARVQKLLENQGLADRIHTAAITYDPAFDLPQRLRVYGQERGVRMDACHRMLRATEGVSALRGHFKLGVNFIESLVNRHRIEVYVLDAEGRIAASFVRLHWDEQEVVDRAAEVLGEELAEPPASRKAASPVLGTLASLGVALFPKCPICWAGYLSLFGIAGLQRIPYAPWLQPLLFAVMLINLASLGLRARTTRRMSGFYLASAGALAILASKIGSGWEDAALWGVALTLAGSLGSALGPRGVQPATREPSRAAS